MSCAGLGVVRGRLGGRALRRVLPRAPDPVRGRLGGPAARARALAAADAGGGARVRRGRRAGVALGRDRRCRGRTGRRAARRARALPAADVGGSAGDPARGSVGPGGGPAVRRGGPVRAPISEELSGLVRVRDHAGRARPRGRHGHHLPALVRSGTPVRLQPDARRRRTSSRSGSTPNLRRAYAALTSGGGARSAPQTFTITTAGEASQRHDSILGRILDARSRLRRRRARARPDRVPDGGGAHAGRRVRGPDRRPARRGGDEARQPGELDHGGLPAPPGGGPGAHGRPGAAAARLRVGEGERTLDRPGRVGGPDRPGPDAEGRRAAACSASTAAIGGTRPRSWLARSTGSWSRSRSGSGRTGRPPTGGSTGPRSTTRSPTRWSDSRSSSSPSTRPAGPRDRRLARELRRRRGRVPDERADPDGPRLRPLPHRCARGCALPRRGRPCSPATSATPSPKRRRTASSSRRRIPTRRARSTQPSRPSSPYDRASWHATNGPPDIDTFLVAWA